MSVCRTVVQPCQTKSIPTIDISPLISPQAYNETERHSVLRSIRQACLDKGFFLVKGHGVPRELQLKTLEWARVFFELPLEEKYGLSEEKSFGRSHRGYQGIGGEAYEARKLPDGKEVCCSHLTIAC